MTDVDSVDSLDWVVISYSDMMSIPSVDPPQSLRDEFLLYKYNNAQESAGVSSWGDDVPSGSSLTVTEVQEIEEVVTTETIVKIKGNTQMADSVLSTVASETICIMTKLNNVDTDQRRRENESFQFTNERPRVILNTVSNQESLEIDEWEVVPDKYLLGVTRSVMDEFKRARAARIQALDRDMEVLVEKFNKIDILNMKWIKKRADYLRLLPSQSPSHCPFCNNLLAKKKKNHCKICSAVICPKCSIFVDYKATRKIINPDASSTLQSKLQNKYYEMLRLCENCERLIELRRIREERQTVVYPLVVEHQDLRDVMEQSKPIVAVFHKISESLLNGETQYQLSDALRMRRRVGELADEIDRRARGLCAGAAPGSRLATLHDAIRHMAYLYVKDNLSHLHLPTQTQVEEVRQKRLELLSSRLRFKNKTIEQRVDS